MRASVSSAGRSTRPTSGTWLRGGGADALALDQVLLLPVHTPPHKELQADPGAEVRLELCRLAVGAAPGIDVSRTRSTAGPVLHGRYAESAP